MFVPVLPLCQPDVCRRTAQRRGMLHDLVKERASVLVLAVELLVIVPVVARLRQL